jgi:hypothetical protein
MPRDEDAIARTKALLKEAERAGWQALTGEAQKRSIHPSKNFGPKSA